MKKLVILLAALMIVGTTAGMALAIPGLVTFEDQTAGTYHNSLVYPQVTFTNTEPVQLFIQNPAPGPVLISNCVIGYDYGNTPGVWQKATFIPSINVHIVSVAMGDFDGDEDTFVLNAYDKFGNLLDTVTKTNPASTYGGPNLAVASLTPIAYVLFNETAPYVGSMYYDNFSYCYQPAPISPSLILFGSGLLALMGFRSRKS
jgi:hypothetical protein